MFKRVARRQRKQERDEEMGLDAETKQVLGLHDTDSDESSSSSESESGIDTGDENEINGAGDLDDEDEDEEDGDGGEGLSDQDEESVDYDASEASEEEEPPLSIQEALRDPLYIISLDPEIRACIACPGKSLKNPIMCEVHRSSNAHVRRYKRFTELARQASPDADIRDIVSQLSAGPEKNIEAGLSKRAEKRQAKLARLKAKRAKQKVMKAKGIAWKKEKAAKASTAASGEEGGAMPASPPTKKHKLEVDGASPRAEVKARHVKHITKIAVTAHLAGTTKPSQKETKSKAERRAKKTAAVSVSPPTDSSNAPSRSPTSKSLKSAHSVNDSSLKTFKPSQRASKGSEQSKLLSNARKRKRSHRDAA